MACVVPESHSSERYAIRLKLGKCWWKWCNRHARRPGETVHLAHGFAKPSKSRPGVARRVGRTGRRSPRVCDTAETESSRAIDTWGHQQKLAVLVQFVGLREVPD